MNLLDFLRERISVVMSLSSSYGIKNREAVFLQIHQASEVEGLLRHRPSRKHSGKICDGLSAVLFSVLGDFFILYCMGVNIANPIHLHI